MEREILELTEKQCENILYEQYYIDEEGTEVKFELIEDKLEDQGRWSISHSLIVKRLSDGKFFSSWYSEGSTESQAHYPYEYDDCKFSEVKPVEETIIVYKWV